MADQATRRARRLSLELKYAAIAVAIVMLFVVLHAVDAFAGVNNTVKTASNWLAGLGSIGVFVIALIANVSIIIQIPYTLPLLSAALGGAGLAEHDAARRRVGPRRGNRRDRGVQGGRRGRRSRTPARARRPGVPVDRPERRSTARALTTFAIFGIALVAAARHHRRDAVGASSATACGALALPLFLGKFVHNVLLALLFYGFASWSADHVSEQASTDLALRWPSIFMVLVLYHAEKSRAGAAERRGPEPGGELAEPPA